MKKRVVILTLSAFIMLFTGVGFSCSSKDKGNDAEVPDNFSIEVIGDTVMSVALGEIGEFSFKVKNHTANDDSLTVDIPDSLCGLPELWMWQICVEGMCLLPYNPATVLVPANGSYDHLQVHIVTDEGGTEGKVTVQVTGIGTEADSQSFYMKITE
ncbi:hypothetical protein JXM67_09520 [candidate division WOR-3 bacterium]|nr:hypothetical protein [candidate division WOR-3 bacterium]